MVNPTIIPAPAFVWPRFYRGYDPRRYGEDAYFPAFGRMPGYGRHEIEPPVPLIVAPQIYPGGRRDNDGRRR
jgi:hypothetical protein